MILSRASASAGGSAGSHGGAGQKPKSFAEQREAFIQARDYAGAITLLEFQRRDADGEVDPELLLWLGYAHFHAGEYAAALEVYREAAGISDNPDILTYIGCCEFYLGQYTEAQANVEQGAPSPLQNRLLFHIAHKFGQEANLMTYHSRLQDVTEDQLCLASIHYMRGHYNEAIEIYKRLLRESRDWTALNIYMAMCYYKLDYYDVSQDILLLYLGRHPDSATAINLKACNHFRLYDGLAAETELKRLHEVSSSNFKFAQDLVRHNMCVFRGGENALQVMTPLVDVLLEARLNLAIHHLRHAFDVGKAYELMRDVDPISPPEYILKAVTNCAYGQAFRSQEHLRLAQQLFQVVGSSSTERDTIPGRQCMASCLYLLGQFDDVLIYLNSIKSYFVTSDDFNYNYGVASAAAGRYVEGEEAFAAVVSEAYRTEICFLGWLARCYIFNDKPQHAWELYMRMESSSESFRLLTLIANDCYRARHYYVAARAFDILHRSDPSPDHLDGKMGACMGVFKQVVTGRQPVDLFQEIVSILANNAQGAPEVDYALQVMHDWARDNGIQIGGGVGGIIDY